MIIDYIELVRIFAHFALLFLRHYAYLHCQKLRIVALHLNFLKKKKCGTTNVLPFCRLLKWQWQQQYFLCRLQSGTFNGNDHCRAILNVWHPYKWNWIEFIDHQQPVITNLQITINNNLAKLILINITISAIAIYLQTGFRIALRVVAHKPRFFLIITK